MKTLWIVEAWSDSFRAIADAVSQNADCELATIKDYSLRILAGLVGQTPRPVVVYASILLVKLMRDGAGKIGVPIYSTDENYLCSVYYPRLKGVLFNDKHEFHTVKDAKEKIWDIYRKLGKESMVFLRPDSGDKPIKGGLTDIQDWNKVLDIMDENAKIMVSTPKTIIGEWRFVVTAYKEILAMSSYQYHGLLAQVPSAPVGATELVRKVLDIGYFPDPVFTIDVGEDADGNFWVIELNSFSSAGLYACDLKAVVAGVSAVAVKEFEKRY